MASARVFDFEEAVIRGSTQHGIAQGDQISDINKNTVTDVSGVK